MGKERAVVPGNYESRLSSLTGSRFVKRGHPEFSGEPPRQRLLLYSTDRSCQPRRPPDSFLTLGECKFVPAAVRIRTNGERGAQSKQALYSNGTVASKSSTSGPIQMEKGKRKRKKPESGTLVASGKPRVTRVEMGRPHLDRVSGERISAFHVYKTRPARKAKANRSKDTWEYGGPDGSHTLPEVLRGMISHPRPHCTPRRNILNPLTDCVLCSVRTQRVRPSYTGIDWLRRGGFGLVAGRDARWVWRENTRLRIGGRPQGSGCL
ncbi:hypothetical protein BJV78DRAFT_1153279 [Lactifluus subvellereus]|nr:hypothetical protein BJV78DRAFT_1153279 [Lactifluus subvellereus]